MEAFNSRSGKKCAGRGLLARVFCETDENARQTAKYLGRYLKKPPVAGARLAHYDGGSRISLRFLDHRTGHYGTLELSQREMILRLIQHIPEKHFRMIRYFGFLANRVVGKLLPLVKKHWDRKKTRR